VFFLPKKKFFTLFFRPFTTDISDGRFNFYLFHIFWWIFYIRFSLVLMFEDNIWGTWSTCPVLWRSSHYLVVATLYILQCGHTSSGKGCESLWLWLVNVWVKDRRSACLEIQVLVGPWERMFSSSSANSTANMKCALCTCWVEYFSLWFISEANVGGFDEVIHLAESS